MDVATLTGLLISFAFTLSSAEKIGRIDTANTGAFRCIERIYSKEECRDMQKKAIARGCISLEEYNVLQKHNRCPVCDWDVEGLDAYEGHCPGIRPFEREKNIRISRKDGRWHKL